MQIEVTLRHAMHCLKMGVPDTPATAVKILFSCQKRQPSAQNELHHLTT